MLGNFDKFLCIVTTTQCCGVIYYSHDVMAAIIEQLAAFSPLVQCRLHKSKRKNGWSSSYHIANFSISLIKVLIDM